MSCLKRLCILFVAITVTSCASMNPSSETGYSYSAEEQALTVTFKNGDSYIYAGVPADVYATVESAESKGKAFNELVKGKYQATKVE
jgi:hypothetical protein